MFYRRVTYMFDRLRGKFVECRRRFPKQHGCSCIFASDVLARSFNMGHWVGVKTFCYVTLERKLTWTFRKHRLGKHISKRTQTEIRKGNTYGSEFTTSFPLASLPTSNREKVLVFQLVGKVTSRRVKYQIYKSEINIIANKSLFQIFRFPCKMICASNIIRYCGNVRVGFILLVQYIHSVRFFVTDEN